MFGKDYFGRMSLENLAIFMLCGDIGQDVRRETSAKEQEAELQEKAEQLLRKLRDDILAYDWKHATEADAGIAMEDMTSELVGVHCHLQYLYFKMGMAAGFNLSDQFRQLCKTDIDA